MRTNHQFIHNNQHEDQSRPDSQPCIYAPNKLVPNLHICSELVQFKWFCSPEKGCFCPPIAARKNDADIFLAESFFHTTPTDSKKQACSADLGAESCPDIDELLSTCVQMNSRCVYTSILVQIRTCFFK